MSQKLLASEQTAHPTYRGISIGIILLILLIPDFSLSQDLTVSGQVVSESDNSPLPGVNVVVKGTSTGTVTDIDGNYNLTLEDPSAILQFSFIGYVSREVPVNNQSTINVSLSEDIEQLGEVVVIGYGTVRKSDLTGSVSSVKGEELVKVPSVNPMQALQGKVAGVQVNSSSGAPGAGPVVRIRGVGSFNDNDPIYVVDGVITNDINFLNSADIQSMEILKDASATAIYGARGANGVILVTTKRGKPGQESVISYSGEYNIQEVADRIDLLNGREYATIYNEITPGTFNNIDVLPNTDWQDLIFSTAPMHNHQISATGASEKMQYYLSVGYFQQEGIIGKSNYERFTFKLNNTYHLSEHVKVGNNITLAPYNQRNAPNVTYAAYRAQPIEAAYRSNGDFAGVNAVGNPLASLAYSNDYNKGFRGVGNAFIEANFLKNFTLRSSYGVDFLYNKTENFTPSYSVLFPDGQPSPQQNIYSSLNKGSTENFSWLWENTISYFKEIDKHRFDVVAGFTLQESTSENFNIRGQNLIRDNRDFWYIAPRYVFDESDSENIINNVSSISNTVDAGLYYSMISYLARVNYTYDNRYILTGTFRRDASSKFTPDNSYANFPSFAVGWNIINEAFMPQSDLLSNLKLRASWGKIGNEKIPYNAQYSLVQSDLVTVFGQEESALPASSFGVTGNPDLRWETTTQTDIGLEIGFWNDKLTAEIDYYYKVTDDILIELAMPGYLGNGVGARQWVNAGEVLNRGLEFNLNWREDNDDFSYSIGVMGSTIHNEVLKIGGSVGVDSVLAGGNLANGQRATLSREELPIGAFYGYKTDGIFQNQSELDAYPHLSNAGVGDLRFVDENEDGVLNTADRTYIGSPIPDFIFGFSFQFYYKNFDFSMDIQGQHGNEIYNAKETIRPDPYNFEQRVMDRWTGEGTSNTVPRPSFGGYNYTLSDYFVQDGSYVRLRTIALGYNFSENMLDRIGLNQARIFVRATNLFTLTDFTGYSPEVVSDEGITPDLSNGVDKGSYPIAKIYSIGLNFNF